MSRNYHNPISWIPVSYTHLDVYKRQFAANIRLSADDVPYVSCNEQTRFVLDNIEQTVRPLSLIHIWYAAVSGGKDAVVQWQNLYGSCSWGEREE